MMDRPTVDLLIYLIIIGGAVTIVYALVCGIYRLISKIRRADREADSIPRTIRANRDYIRRRIGNG